MKTLTTAVLFTLSLSACHYGQNEAAQTIERNEQYKTEKAEYSVNKAGEYGSEQKNQAATVDTTAKTSVDTTQSH